MHFAGEVCATVGATTWTTSLVHKDGRYLLPLKAAVRAAEQIELGDHVIGRVYAGPHLTGPSDGERRKALAGRSGPVSR